MRKTGDPGFLVVLYVGSGSFHGVGLPETSYCSEALVYKSLFHCIHMLICQDTMQESADPLRVSLGGSHTYLLSYAISPVLVLKFKVSICLNFLLWKLQDGAADFGHDPWFPLLLVFSGSLFVIQHSYFYLVFGSVQWLRGSPSVWLSSSLNKVFWVWSAFIA